MRPVDRLLYAFLALLAATAAVFVPSPWPVIAAAAGMALVLFASRRFVAVHAFMPVPILALLVNVVGPVIEHANPARWDLRLAAFDAHWFGPLAVAWHNALGRPGWLTACASAAYAIYYLLPVGAAVALWRARRFDEFDRFTVAMSTVILASYASYLIAPASGPRDPAALASPLRVFLGIAEQNQLDAFPSGHTAVSLVFLAEAWTLFPKLRAALSFAVAAIVFSTVYLSLHYVVDVVGGVALAAVVLAVLQAEMRAMGWKTA